MGYGLSSRLEVARCNQQLQYDDHDAPCRTNCMVSRVQFRTIPCNLQVGATVGFASVVRNVESG